MYMFIGIDPPTSDGLIDHPQVPTALLVFVIVAAIIFMSVTVAVIVFIVALREHRYVTHECTVMQSCKNAVDGITKNRGYKTFSG